MRTVGSHRYTIEDIRYIQEHMDDDSASIAEVLDAPQGTIIEYMRRIRRNVFPFERYQVVRYYAVYLRKTDELVCSGTSRECADALGVTIKSFYVMVHKALHGKVKKWDIYIEEYNVEDEE